jgi:hypothetical protein
MKSRAVPRHVMKHWGATLDLLPQSQPYIHNYVFQGMFKICISVSILLTRGQDTACPDRFFMVFLILPGKFQDGTSVRPPPLPSNSLPIYYSPNNPDLRHYSVT